MSLRSNKTAFRNGSVRVIFLRVSQSSYKKHCTTFHFRVKTLIDIDSHFVSKTDERKKNARQGPYQRHSGMHSEHPYTHTHSLTPSPHSLSLSQFLSVLLDWQQVLPRHPKKSTPCILTKNGRLWGKHNTQRVFFNDG